MKYTPQRSLSKIIEEYVNILIFIFSNIIYRMKIFFLFLIYRKHQIHRICLSDNDEYTKTFLIYEWLLKTRNPRILSFKASKTLCLGAGKYQGHYVDDLISTNLESRPHDILALDLQILGSKIKDDVKQLTSLILKEKRMVGVHQDKKQVLHDCLKLILQYEMLITLAKSLSCIQYSDEYKENVIKFWNNLVPSLHHRSFKNIPDKHKHKISNQILDIHSERWSYVGFQGDDPGTDFRGMGLLALLNLCYLSAQDVWGVNLLRSSLKEEYGYPYAIVSINLTNVSFQLLVEGHFKHYFFDRSPRNSLNFIEFLNKIYTELYIKFDKYWQESEPKNLLEFNSIMQSFVQKIKVSLEDRRFDLEYYIS